MSDSYFLGADLGGTSLRVGAVSTAGELLGEVLSVPTGRDFGPEELKTQMRALTQRLRRTLADSQWRGVGFGTAGVVHDDGPLSHSDNLPRLSGTPLRALLEETLACPVVVENDARCFVLAEARFGAAKGARNVCGVTLGTGLGSGLIVGGRLIRGVSSQAGEVCHIPFKGHHLEYFLSAAGVLRAFQAAGGDPDGLDGARLAELARGGSAPARAAWQAFGDDVASLCAFVIALVEPEVIVVGGSLAQAYALFGDVIAARLADRRTKVVDAKLGPRAGVIGAAVLAMPRERTRAYRRSVRTTSATAAPLEAGALKLKSGDVL
jgi:glucokinase